MITSAFSFSEAATGGVLWKKVFLKISQNSQENTFGLRNFQKHLFYRTPLDSCFLLFRATLLKWGTANSVYKTWDEYSLSRNTNVRSSKVSVWNVWVVYGSYVIKWSYFSYISYITLVQIQKASKDLNLVSHFHWSHFVVVIFFFFFCLSQFCFVFSCRCS